ncbi:MAG: hypothetical protein WCT07_00220 [Candidatus Paceibacterota bacterium]|jgi:hypothetical protein
MGTTKSKQDDGGYYAIKGFTYQFDKSILEALNNPHSDIEIEQIQDIGLGNFYIQVKYKESKKYTPSSIKKALTQLLELSIIDKKKTFKLYAFFKDKAPEKKFLNISELDKILGTEKDKYTLKNKEHFLKHFILEFSDNFEQQFKDLISKIKTGFKLTTDEEATVYHALFKSNLLDIAIIKEKKQRLINFNKLKTLVNKKEKVIFELAYCKFLSNNKYLSYLKKEYFTFKKINIPCKERLIVIQIDDTIRDSNLLEIVTNIKNKYFRKDISPSPYICLYGIDTTRLNLLKQSFLDKGLHFSDGTHFNGDKFRIQDLIVDTYKDSSNVAFKIISEEFLPFLFKKGKLDEVYVFSTLSKVDLQENLKDLKEFYIQHTKDIIKIIS